MPRPPTAIVFLLSSFASRLDTRHLAQGAAAVARGRAGPLAFGHTGSPHSVVLPDG